MSAQPHVRQQRQDPLFSWTERPVRKGQKPRSGEIRARSVEHARFQLGRQGIKAAHLRRAREVRPGRVNALVTAAFVRQLAVMIQSGVPLAQSLGLIAGGMGSKKKRNMLQVVQSIRADVESGQKLSDAMRKHPHCFDTLFCNTLAAGEDSGQLDTALVRLANHMEKSLRIKQRIRKAMIYPGIVVLTAITVTVGMLLFVLPSFKAIYSQFQAELPGLTVLLLAASDTLKEHGLWLLIGLSAGVYGLMRAYRRSPRFKRWADRLILKLPVFGELMRTAIHARWTRTFATLSTSGVPIIATLDSVAGVANNHEFQIGTQQVRQDVATGKRVSDSLEKTGMFPPETVQMIRIGEESGRMDSMLERLADQYEIRLDDLVDTLSTIIEPMIMCIIGVLVGVLIVGMYLPIFNIGGIV